MKKLLLTSSASKTIKFIDRLTNKPLNELKVGFIPTASNLYKDAWWVEKDRNALLDLGMKVFDIDIEKMSNMELEEALCKQDVIFVAG